MSDLILIELVAMIGTARSTGAAGALGDGVWYEADTSGDGLLYRFDSAALARAAWLCFDLLLDGDELAVFQLLLQAGEHGPAFRLSFGALNQCQAQVRLPIGALRQNVWMLGREGAVLKRLCAGDVVDPARVDRATLTLLRRGEKPARWCQTSLRASTHEPPTLADPILPRGPLLDEFGQSTHRDWATKTRSEPELIHRLQAQRDLAGEHRWPDGFSKWGGWMGGRERQEPAGFFRRHHDGRRWWLVDPDGFPFFSAGQNSIVPDTSCDYSNLGPALKWLPPREGEFAHAHGSPLAPQARQVNYLIANFVRAFGAGEWQSAWGHIAIGELRRCGFNTIGNWSFWQMARYFQFPYVRPLEFHARRTPAIFRDFPDVFAPSFEQDAADFAREQLSETRDDPAMIGYFLMNEPTWGFAAQTPAEGMLLNAPQCATREALATFLRERYQQDQQRFAAAWGGGATFDMVARGVWAQPLSASGIRADLTAFSTVMVRKLFHTLAAACRAIDPNHLNLGARYHTVPPAWALEGMDCFDVFSVNQYREKLDPALGDVSAKLNCPVLSGEWHFGALDVGLPATGIGRVRDQVERGRAYRAYLEHAAAQPWCIGAHHFILYDQSALGRFDGENYNIGFLDVCNRPYDPLCDAARTSHERMYSIAAGQLPPFGEPVDYLPRLFL